MSASGRPFRHPDRRQLARTETLARVPNCRRSRVCHTSTAKSRGRRKCESLVFCVFLRFLSRFTRRGLRTAREADAASVFRVPPWFGSFLNSGWIQKLRLLGPQRRKRHCPQALSK
jgi:hypothetical protein